MSMRDKQSSSSGRSSDRSSSANQPPKQAIDDPEQTADNAEQAIDDAAYLRKLLETLSAEDPAVFNELMMSNSLLADEYHRANPQIDRIRDALVHDAMPVHASEDSGANSAAPLDETAGVELEFAKVVAQIKERLSRGEEAMRPLIGASFESPQDAGILTNVTRQLSAEQARQLFEKLAPMLVYTTLKHMNCNCSFDEVDRIAGRLCGHDAQTKLRQAEHTRDALVDELLLAMVEQGVGSSEAKINGVGSSLDRAEMTRLLEESGAMADLVAMSNCILLAKTQAG